MPAYQAYLGNGQALLEKTADGLMAQIMKPEVLDACAALQTLPSKSDGVGRHWEHMIIIMHSLLPR